MSGRIDTDPDAFGAHPRPQRGDGGNKLTGTRDSKIELERLRNDLSIVVGDQRHRGALTDIDRNHQTPLLRQITDPGHIPGLGHTTREARHMT